MSGPRKPVLLALQGGGAHGAFTWGVLDRLLEDGRLEVAAISGTSAGAMNAVVLADGMLKGGPAEARRALWAFWKAISRAARQAGWHARVYEAFFGGWGMPVNPFAIAYDVWSRVVSPYQVNPLNWNPVMSILREAIDFDRLRRPGSPRLFIAATAVRTGQLRVFRNEDLSPEAVMASACLPTVFQAVEIEGEAFWDGGYTGNPALFPLIAENAQRDLVLVQINPELVKDVPRTARGIADRIDEITFNSSLYKELRALANLKESLAQTGRARVGAAEPTFLDRVEGLLMHRIHDDEVMGSLSLASRYDPQWEFLIKLHGAGRRAASRWLAANFSALGRRSSVALEDCFR